MSGVLYVVVKLKSLGGRPASGVVIEAMEVPNQAPIEVRGGYRDPGARPAKYHLSVTWRLRSLVVRG